MHYAQPRSKDKLLFFLLQWCKKVEEEKEEERMRESMVWAVPGLSKSLDHSKSAQYDFSHSPERAIVLISNYLVAHYEFLTVWRIYHKYRLKKKLLK